MADTNNAQNLDDLKKSLYKAFNKAMDGVDYREHYNEKFPAMVQIATGLAEKIVEIEREQALQDLIKQAKENGRDIEIDLDKRVIRSITPAGTQRIKPLS